MPKHGDLQLPLIDARPDQQTKQPAREAIQQEREHGRSLTGSHRSLQRRQVSGPIEYMYPTATMRVSDSFDPGVVLAVALFSDRNHEHRERTVLYNGMRVAASERARYRIGTRVEQNLAIPGGIESNDHITVPLLWVRELLKPHSNGVPTTKFPWSPFTANESSSSVSESRTDRSPEK